MEGADAVDFLAVLEVGQFEIVMELEAEKESGGHPEEAGKSEIMDGGDAAFAVLHFRDVAGDDAAGDGEIFLTEGRVLDDFAECFGEGVEEGDGLFRCHGSVVVCDSHVVSVIKAKYFRTAVRKTEYRRLSALLDEVCNLKSALARSAIRL